MMKNKFLRRSEKTGKPILSKIVHSKFLNPKKLSYENPSLLKYS